MSEVLQRRNTLQTLEYLTLGTLSRILNVYIYNYICLKCVMILAYNNYIYARVRECLGIYISCSIHSVFLTAQHYIA